MKLIRSAFKDVDNFEYLQGSQDNTLQVSAQQELDGCGVIKLAGFGCLYVHQISSRVDSESSSSTDNDRKLEDSVGASTKKLIERADEVLRKLQVSQI